MDKDLYRSHSVSPDSKKYHELQRGTVLAYRAQQEASSLRSASNGHRLLAGTDTNHLG